MANDVQAENIQYSGSDHGENPRYFATCPKCKQVFQVSERQFWETRCKCGILWRVDFVAIVIGEHYE